MNHPDYKKLHTIYKSLKHLKSLISSDVIISSVAFVDDTFEVYFARLKELIELIEHEQTVKTFSIETKMRLIGMHIIVHHEYLDVSVQHSLHRTDALNRLMELLQMHTEHRLNKTVALIYFKSLMLLLKLNQSDNQYWLNVASEMFSHLTKCSTQINFYECDEFFTKSENLKPLNVKQQRIIVKQLVAEMKKFSKQNFSIDNCIRFHKDEQTPFEWSTKLLNHVPKLFNAKKFEKVAIYLLSASKVLDRCNGSVKCLQTITNIRSTIVTHWMHYTFSILNESKMYLLQSISNVKRIFKSNERFSTNDAQNFLQLDEDHQRICKNKLYDIDEAKHLITFSIRMIQRLINDGDFHAEPLKYIMHIYQLSDLLELSSSILSFNFENAYFNQLKRIHYFEEMLKWLNIYHPSIFHAISFNITNELNQIIGNLYKENFNRMLNQTKNIQNAKQIELEHLLRSKIDQLNELNAIVLSTHKITK